MGNEYRYITVAGIWAFFLGYIATTLYVVEISARGMMPNDPIPRGPDYSIPSAAGFFASGFFILALAFVASVLVHEKARDRERERSSAIVGLVGGLIGTGAFWVFTMGYATPLVVAFYLAIITPGTVSVWPQVRFRLIEVAAMGVLTWLLLMQP